MTTEEEIREMIRKQLGAQGRATRYGQVVALREGLENWIVNCWNEMKAERDTYKDALRRIADRVDELETPNHDPVPFVEVRGLQEETYVIADH